MRKLGQEKVIEMRKGKKKVTSACVGSLRGIHFADMAATSKDLLAWQNYL